MNYPLISEYIDAIKSSEDNFEELSYLRPVFGDDGLPVMTGGNFAVVFKMKDERSGKFYAIKCFTKEQEGRAEAYREIAKELKDVSSPYILSIRYIEKELFVDTDQTVETEFPVLLMDWVEGKTLDKYLRESLDDRYALEMLAYRFSQLAQWLIPQPFAHGDLKPDNILVRGDGTLVLVDYDGMYVPAMKGQKARELGSPNFRHPLRTADDFDEHIDDFPMVSILFSLKAISIKPLLLEEFGESNRLLFSENDYRDISNSPIMQTLLYLLSIKDVALMYSIFMYSIIHFGVNNHLLSNINDLHLKPILSDLYEFTRINENDNEEWVEDENRGRYSKDGVKFLRGNFLYKSYEIREGTEIICDKAFSNDHYYDDVIPNHYDLIWNDLEQIIIPNSIKFIGRNPFVFCYTHNIVCNSPYYLLEEDTLYTLDRKHLIGYYGYKKESFIVPEGVTTIGDYAFAGLGLKSIKLPSTTISIGDYAFYGCLLLENIEMHDNIEHIGRCAFLDCKRLQQIELPKGLISIGSLAFSGCGSICTISIPSTVLSIGVNPFLYDKNLTLYNDSHLYEVENNILYTKGKKYLISYLSKESSFVMPKEVTHIGQYAFLGQPLKRVYFHDNIMYIGKKPFNCYYTVYSDIPSETPWFSLMELFVSKGRAEWAKRLIHQSDPFAELIIKEVDAL